MNNFISIIFFYLLLLSCSTTKSKLVNGSPVAILDSVKNLSYFKNDTAAYLRFIVSQKVKYINQPLDSFLKDLEIPIISFSAAPTLLKSENKTISLYTDEAKMFYSKLDTKSNTAIEIIIDWQFTQPMDSARAVYVKNRTAEKSPTIWSDDAKKYFGKLIVGNIKLPYYLND